MTKAEVLNAFMKGKKIHFKARQMDYELLGTVMIKVWGDWEEGMLYRNEMGMLFSRNLEEFHKFTVAEEK